MPKVGDFCSGIQTVPPPKENLISIAGLQPNEVGRTSNDFLIKVTAVRPLNDPSSGMKSVGVQLANFLAGGTASLEFSNADGCLAITQTTGTAVREFFYGDTGYSKFPDNVKYLFRNNGFSGNNYIDGQIDYPEKGTEVHIITTRASLKDMPKIAERIFNFLALWRFPANKQN